MESLMGKYENHLLDIDPPSEEELASIKQLRERISDLNISEEDGTERNLVRFIRARNGNVADAELMFRNNHHWRETEDVKSLLLNYECPSGWEQDFHYRMTGFDRTGCPVLVAPFGSWDIQKEAAYGNKEEFVKYVYHNMEKAWTMVQRLSKGQNHMKQVVGIVDLEGLSFRQVTSIDVVEAAIRCLKTFEANYPETVKAAVIVNAPWAFQMLWKLIKPFLSERTHAKLAFVGGDKEKWRDAILKLCEPDQFPEYYGGRAPDSTEFYIGRDGTWSKSRNQNDSDYSDEEKSIRQKINMEI